MGAKKRFKREDLEVFFRSGSGVFNYNVGDSVRSKDGELDFGHFDYLALKIIYKR